MNMPPINRSEPRLILMTTDTIGGVWNYSLELARGLTRHGTRVALATMGQPISPSQRLEAEEIDGLQLIESEYRVEWMEDPWEDVEEAGRWLRSLETELEPDIIHLNGYAHGAVDFAALKVVVAHSCVLSWWQAVKGEHAPDGWEEYELQVRRGLQYADTIVVPTCAMRHAIEEYYGITNEIRVIPNGRDPRDYQPREKEDFIFAAGRLGDDAKNIRTLASAAVGLPWSVRVAGADADPSGSVDLPPNLEYCGRLAAAMVADQMAHAAIYCLPARYEPFGLSVLEAALSGCALVLGDIPSLRENWDGAALFVPPHDVTALRDSITTLINDRALRTCLGRAARQRALAFSSDRMVAGYRALYRGLLQNSAIPAVTS